MSEYSKLAERFRRMAADGLVDVRFYLSNKEEASVEQACQEANELYGAVDAGRARPLDFKDSKRIAIIAAAAMLIACPALAQQTTADSASKAAAYASTGTTIFEASRTRNNTPDVFAARSEGTTNCQYPGFSFGIGQPGFGLSTGIPLGTDADCMHERMARFRMQSAEMLRAAHPAEAQRNIVAANESLCRISYNIGTAMCAPAPAPQPVTVYYYCRNPAGYYPAVQGCLRWETVPPR